MNLLIDTNVLLDMILCRKNYQSSFLLFNKMRLLPANGYISASSATDLFYILRKETHSTEHAYELLTNILKLVSILPVTANDIFEAYSLRWTDFEDCVQYTVAKNHLMDYIITNNPKDFALSSISVLSPDAFVNQQE